MENQEYLIQLQMLEQQANQLEEQVKLINQQIKEMLELKENVEELESFGEEEIFSELGKGIYLKSKLVKSDFLIEVGSKILVPKTVKEIGEIIDEQTKKLDKAKEELSDKIERINEELNKIISESKKTPEKNNTK